MNTIENACIPPELEKISTPNPKRKEKNKNLNLFSCNGYKNTKEMYKYGFINPKKRMLFKTNTCNSNNKINKNAM